VFSFGKIFIPTVMSLTVDQHKSVEGILHDSGVVVSDIPSNIFACSVQNITRTSPRSLHLPLISYIPPAPSFSLHSRFKVTRKSSLDVDYLIDHPLGALIEYPQTGSRMGESIAHRFTIDPNDFVNPRKNMQYSIGKGKDGKGEGGHKDVQFFLISGTPDSKKGVLCYQFKAKCMFLFYFLLYFLI